MKTVTLIVATVLGACSTADLAESGSEQAIISDQAHSGRRGFYFLAPLVAEPDPDGVFDASLAPSVEVRELDTDRLVAAFTSVRADLDDELYAVNWDTLASNLDPARSYRIRVLAAGQILGFADVDVVDNGRELKNVNTDESIALLDGRTLPIKFRIEAGILCEGDAASCVVRVPSDAATVQEAVDRVGDQGVVVLAAGTYTESVRIASKRVHIVGDPGSGSRSTRFELPASSGVRDLALAHGIFEYGAGGGGRLENLALVGGDVAVKGSGATSALAELSIANVEMLDNGFGVAGTWPRLELDKVSIIGAADIGYFTCGGDQSIFESFIENSGQMGMFAANCNATSPISVNIDDSSIAFNAGGGAAFLGNVNLWITDSQILFNRVLGIGLFGVSDAVVIDTTVAYTDYGDLGNYEGVADGLLAVSSPSTFLFNTHFLENQRTGIFLFDASSADLLSTESSGSLYGMAVLHDSTWTDLGNNVITGTSTAIHTDGDLSVPDPPPIPDGV